MPEKTITTTDNETQDIKPQQHKVLGTLLEELNGKTLNSLGNEYLVLNADSFRGGAQQEKSEKSADTKIWQYSTQTTTPEIVGSLRTYNIAAWLGVNTEKEKGKIEIHSRFDKSKHQYFLQYMLYKVFCPHLLQNNIDFSIGSGLDILPLLFSGFVRSAYELHGVYKEYVRQDANDDRVRGPVDVARHIKENTPFIGKIAYRLRRHEYDNRITRLILFALTHLQKHKRWRGFIQRVKSQDPLFSEALAIMKQQSSMNNFQPEIQAKTQDCYGILKQSEKPIRSPYYSQYERLRQLCRQILQYQELNLHGNRESSGIILDLAWLWEEYLAQIVPQDSKVTHAYARQSGGKQIYKDKKSFLIYPDFYKEGEIVLDAKYKGLSNRKNF